VPGQYRVFVILGEAKDLSRCACTGHNPFASRLDFTQNKNALAPPNFTLHFYTLNLKRLGFLTV